MNSSYECRCHSLRQPPLHFPDNKPAALRLDFASSEILGKFCIRVSLQIKSADANYCQIAVLGSPIGVSANCLITC